MEHSTTFVTAVTIGFSALVSVGASDTATVTITDNDGANDRDRSYVCVISDMHNIYAHNYVRTHLFHLRL